MAYKIRVTVDFDWVPDGAGPSFTGQNQGNNPGFGSAQGSGIVGVSQTMELMVAEAVPGGDAPSSANFNTALSAAATDIGTMLTTAAAAPGYTSGTPLAAIQAWATGGP